MNTTFPRKKVIGKLDEDILVEAIGSGMTYVEAGKLAGSKGQSANTINNAVVKKLKRSSTAKRSIIEKLAEKQHQILDSIKLKEIKAANLAQKSISFGVFTDKLQLLKGDPTERMEVMPRMVFRGDTLRFTNKYEGIPSHQLEAQDGTASTPEPEINKNIPLLIESSTK